MKAFSKVAVACVLFFALAGSAWATGVEDSGKKPHTAAGTVRSLAAADDDIPGVAIPASPIYGTLDEESDWDDVFSIYLNAGDTLSASLNGAPGTDFGIYLYAPGTTFDDDPAIASDEEIYFEFFDYVAPTSGTYYLDAFGGYGAGNYAVYYSVAPASPLTPVYRFYNKINGSHFYTASLTEKSSVFYRLGATYELDGVAYSVNTANALNNAPLYRFYNKKNGSHFYTASLAEKNSVQANLSATYAYDGPAYNVCMTPSATTVWRFYNKKNGSHFYTASLDEKNTVINTLGQTYALDGEAFWIAP